MTEQPEIVFDNQEAQRITGTLTGEATAEQPTSFTEESDVNREQLTNSTEENDTKTKESSPTSDSGEINSETPNANKELTPFAEPTKITSEQDLINNLTSSAAGSYILTQDIVLTKALTIPANKELDLNQHKITATTASSATASGKLIVNSSAVTSVIIKNGTIIGGDSRGLGSS